MVLSHIVCDLNPPMTKRSDMTLNGLQLCKKLWTMGWDFQQFFPNSPVWINAFHSSLGLCFHFLVTIEWLYIVLNKRKKKENLRLQNLSPKTIFLNESMWQMCSVSNSYCDLVSGIKKKTEFHNHWSKGIRHSEFFRNPKIGSCYFNTHKAGSPIYQEQKENCSGAETRKKAICFLSSFLCAAFLNLFYAAANFPGSIF